MARPERLELPAYWFEANRSIQLSYGRAWSDRDPWYQKGGIQETEFRSQKRDLTAILNSDFWILASATE